MSHFKPYTVTFHNFDLLQYKSFTLKTVQVTGIICMYFAKIWSRDYLRKNIYLTPWVFTDCINQLISEGQGQFAKLHLIYRYHTLLMMNKRNVGRRGIGNRLEENIHDSLEKFKTLYIFRGLVSFDLTTNVL